jgi:two-component system chemotaxis response regulator CheB
MPGHDIIVLGTSAGGVEALSRLVQGMPPNLPAALFVVCHFPSGARSILPEILSRAGPLPATHAQDGEIFQPGHVYVAPPDYHLVLSPGRIELTHGARENHHRPAIDPLFRSAARVYGQRVVGVILSGSLNDGVAGLLAIRSAGGLAVVQDPEGAAFAAMPRNAREIAGADYTLPLEAIPTALVQLARQPVEGPGDLPMPDPIEDLPARIHQDMAQQETGMRRGKLTVLTCPECGGSLWQADQEELMRFRCHVGHAYYGETLLAEQSEMLEAALWTAVRTFKEKTILGRELTAQARARGDLAAAKRFAEDADLADRYGRLIQDHVLKAPATGDEAPVNPPPIPDKPQEGRG